MEDITVSELKERIESGKPFHFIDVREEWEYEEDNLGANNIPPRSTSSAIDSTGWIKKSGNHRPLSLRSKKWQCQTVFRIQRFYEGPERIGWNFSLPLLSGIVKSNSRQDQIVQSTKYNVQSIL